MKDPVRFLNYGRRAEKVLRKFVEAEIEFLGLAIAAGQKPTLGSDRL
jgi:hypothetical protein